MDSKDKFAVPYTSEYRDESPNRIRDVQSQQFLLTNNVLPKKISNLEAIMEIDEANIDRSGVIIRDHE
jgi:hypothetical protein